MKAMLKSGSTDEMAASHSRQSAQRRESDRSLMGDHATSLSSLANAPRTVAQRQQMQAAFGSTIQRAGLEEELPAQGKGLSVQRQSLEEEPMQGKFGPVQRETGAHESAAPNRTRMPNNLKAGI